MSISLSSLVDNLSKIYKKECKKCMEKEKTISEGKFIGIEGNKLSYRYKRCNDKSDKPINDLIKKFPNIYKFCNGDVNKFGLLLRKGVYTYE